MKYLSLYLKSQIRFLFIGIGTLLVPYTLICMYMPKIPFMHWFFILIIFLIKLLVIDDGKFRKNIRPKVQSQLTKELKKNPSNDQIYKRIIFYTKARDFNLALFGISILVLAIIFNQF